MVDFWYVVYHSIYVCISLTKYETSQLRGREFSFGTQLQSTIYPFGEGKTQLSGVARAHGWALFTFWLWTRKQEEKARTRREHHLSTPYPNIYSIQGLQNDARIKLKKWEPVGKGSDPTITERLTRIWTLLRWTQLGTLNNWLYLTLP